MGVIKICIAGFMVFQIPILENAKKFDIEPEIITAIIYYESRFKHDVINYKTNCKGLMQVKGGSLIPDKNIKQGSSILSYYLNRRNGNIIEALSCYNQGYSGFLKNGINNYAKKVYSLYKKLKNSNKFQKIKEEANDGKL